MIQEQTLTPEEEKFIDQEMRRRGNSKLISYLLWFFLGVLGVHRFYNDAIKTGIIQVSLLITGFMLLIYLGSLDLPTDTTALEKYTQCSELHPNDLQTCMPYIDQFLEDQEKGDGKYANRLSVLIFILLGIIVLWWLVDAFLIPSLVERKNQSIRQKYGQKALSQRNTSRL
ncbi:MAG: NINE protein [Saezia sp.]